MADVTTAIHERLTDLGWSQADLARAAGMRRQDLHAMLAKKRPLTVRYLLILDNTLGLGLDYARCLIPKSPAQEIPQCGRSQS